MFHNSLCMHWLYYRWVKKTGQKRPVKKTGKIPVMVKRIFGDRGHGEFI